MSGMELPTLLTAVFLVLGGKFFLRKGFKPKGRGTTSADLENPTQGKGAAVNKSTPINTTDRHPTTANIQITEEFDRVGLAVQQGRSPIFVTGTAGTGKSTLVHFLKATVKKRMAVVAPTGIAALNVGGQTIHSFFRFPPRPINLSEIVRLRDRSLFKALELLIVDEVSMVRSDLLDAMERSLRLNAREKDMPFGGVQVLFVGDLFQLPPVVAKSEEAAFIGMNHRSRFFFDARCISAIPPEGIELTRVFRQDDPHFLKLLANLRVGGNLPQVIREFNRLVDPQRPRSDRGVTLTCTNQVANNINDEELRALPGRPVLYEGTVSGTFNLKDAYLPSPPDLHLKAGARVMLTANDPQKRWVNGSAGVVVKLRENTIDVTIDGGVCTCEVEPFTWEQIAYTFDRKRGVIVAKELGSYTQFPLRLAWAVTIHKAQGLTLEAAHVDLGNGAFDHGQVYVALSRCKSMKNLSLEKPIRLQDIRCDDVVKRFQADRFVQH